MINDWPKTPLERKTASPLCVIAPIVFGEIFVWEARSAVINRRQSRRQLKGRVLDPVWVETVETVSVRTGLFLFHFSSTSNPPLSSKKPSKKQIIIYLTRALRRFVAQSKSHSKTVALRPWIINLDNYPWALHVVPLT